MGNTNSADFSSFKKVLSPTAFACFRVLFENTRETIATRGPQQKYETSLDDVLSLSGVADVESVAQAIREIIQCQVEKHVENYVCFYPFLASVSIEAGKIRYSIHKDIEEEVSRIPAIFFV
ncbi:MAG: hypothetical protein EHM79_10935 [Geobacter sp.]|nr:MAG: hypothetical protein EHM79_10935 [Geobacter sp.]